MHGLDALALGWMLLIWVGYTLIANYLARSHTCLASVLFLYRKQWMLSMLRRDNRIADASCLDQLRSSVSFFASTTILIIAGLATGMAASEQGLVVLSYLPLADTNTHEVWEYKILAMTAIFIYGFFEFSWSLRLYNYCAVLIGSAPLIRQAHENKASANAFSETAARSLSTAAKHFNYGLRAYYFGLATLAWFVSVWWFLLMATGVVLLLYLREFHSRVLKTLAYSSMEES
ncbi:DUF599 domain-containing protein [Parendozoicomonas haliclonae]|uniref:DUF599 domain-containing protein n=1 Tax=Parendozoicomonas haliclonae TaxID=1960125 RepID=A0A1X7AJY8_9GAMM|nr:DUF599 family protein [Parendozoicomonas haliclonae]SMA47292.1 hypothetical protein EHSB41UT_02364 [Parendozoicomonas haliclonae]